MIGGIATRTTSSTPLRFKKDAPMFVPRRLAGLQLPIDSVLESPPSLRSRIDTLDDATKDGRQHCWDSWSDQASTRYVESEAEPFMMTPSAKWCGMSCSVASVCSEPVDETFHAEDFQPAPAAAHADASSPFTMYYVGSFMLTDASVAPQCPEPWHQPLQVSADSWVARRRAQRQQVEKDGDSRVTRQVKSIMNKLTVESFSRLSQQLARCARTEAHVKLLAAEVFKAAAAQHNFIDMYADLGVALHKHFEQSPVAGAGRAVSFKRLLVLECSRALERSSQEPADAETAMKHKDQTLGSMKLIGALCMRGLLAGSVLLAVSEHLLPVDTPEMLESLAALLTAAGPAFDTPDFEGHEALEELFDSMRAISEAPKRDTRTRCLLRDVLDLRARGWEKSGQKQAEAPS